MSPKQLSNFIYVLLSKHLELHALPRGTSDVFLTVSVHLLVSKLAV